MNEEKLKGKIAKTIASILEDKSQKELKSLKERKQLIKNVIAWLNQSENIDNIIQDTKTLGTIANSILKISIDHEQIMKKIGRNTTAHKNFKRAVENRFKKSKEILTKTETLTMPLVTLIYYLQTRNECLEKTLEEIMRNTPGKFNHNNFTLKDLQDMSIKPKTHPTLKKTHVKRTLKKLQITKRRRAVNRTDLHILKEKMKATSSIQIKKKMFAGEWREIQFKDIIDNQISKQRDFTLTQIARLASKTTNQNIIIEGINATFTSTVNNKDIENILYEISIGETDEDKEKNRKKAKKYAQVNWKKHHKNKVTTPTNDCPKMCCLICKTLLGEKQLPTFRKRGMAKHENVHKDFYKITNKDRDMLFPTYKVLTKE